MEIQKIIENVTEFFNDHVAPLHKVIAVEEYDQEEDSNKAWRLVVEAVEEREYMKRYAKDEMIGVYEVFLNKDKEIISFKRRDIRLRSSVEMEHSASE
jgi:hypothetical protein